MLGTSGTTPRHKSTAEFGGVGRASCSLTNCRRSCRVRPDELLGRDGVGTMSCIEDSGPDDKRHVCTRFPEVFCGVDRLSLIHISEPTRPY